MTNTELIDELIRNLEADVRIASERLRATIELRETWNVTPVESAPTVEVEVAPEAPKPEPKAKPKKSSGQVNCPDCGQTFASPNALGPHRRAKHGHSAAKPVGPLRSVDVDPDRVLRCSDCGEECATEISMSNHTFNHHGRPPLILEKQPVTPRAVA